MACPKETSKMSTTPWGIRFQSIEPVDQQPEDLRVDPDLIAPGDWLDG